MKYKLYKGDCLEVMDKLIEEGVKVDFILTDLPYGRTRAKWDKIIPLQNMWVRIDKLIYDNTCICLFSDNPFTSMLVSSNMKYYKYDWIWVKEQGKNFQHCKKMPLKKVEYINVFYKKQPTYNAQGLVKLDKPIIKKNKNKFGKLMDNNSERIRDTYEQWYTNYPSNILEFNTDRGLHPTQKPVALLEYLIKTYTDEGDLVLDFTMGSGSTGVACLNTNRRFIGIELDENYFNIAKKRIKDTEKEIKNK